MEDHETNSEIIEVSVDRTSILDSGPSLPTTLPAPRCPVKIRPATEQDLPFIDALQKMHTHMVGWFPHQQMAAYVNSGHVLIAEHDAEPRMQIGYCIARDKYSGRDDVGIIYQLNVMPARQKHLVGAMLIQATFQRAAYGCRLFSCWCAQDIQANFFWETLGFVPLAFRTGSRGKQRTHIFWQRRVCANDSTTPWWYPCETRGGAIREDRLVFPIPPDVHWRDAKPIILPGSKLDPGGELKPLVTAVQKRRPRPASSTAQRIAVVRSQSKHLMGLPAGKAAVITGGGIRYLDRADYAPDSSRKASMKPSAPQNDPKLAAAARELRDRWLERVNLDPRALVANGKYEVARCLPATNYPNGAMLPAA